MASTGSHSSAHTFLDSATKFFVVEEGDMLLPRQTYHDAETLLLRSIQQPARRHTVSADSVHAVSDDLGKVSLNNVRMWVLAAVFIGAEWPISHTANIEFVVAEKNEFAFYMRAGIGPRRCRYTSKGWGIHGVKLLVKSFRNLCN